jgi:hypothetical protein
VLAPEILGNFDDDDEDGRVDSEFVLESLNEKLARIN